MHFQKQGTFILYSKYKCDITFSPIPDVQQKVLVEEEDKEDEMELDNTLKQQLNNQFDQVAAIAPHSNEEKKIKADDYAKRRQVNYTLSVFDG